MDMEDQDLLDALDQERCKEKYIQNLKIKTRTNLQPIMWFLVTSIGFVASMLFLVLFLLFSNINLYNKNNELKARIHQLENKK